MKEIKKMGLANALVLFRSELSDVKISPKKRIALMEEFKQAFDRSYDYDLATQSVLARLVPDLAVAPEEEEESFKSFWGTMSKANKTVHFYELDMNEFLAIKDQIREEVLNEGRDPEDVAAEISKEYGLYYNDVFAIAMHIGNPSMGIKTKSQEVEKGFADWLSGKSGLIRQLKGVIDQDFKDGLTETDVINSLLLDAAEKFGRALTQGEIDIIRMYVIDEKVKLFGRVGHA